MLAETWAGEDAGGEGEAANQVEDASALNRGGGRNQRRSRAEFQSGGLEFHEFEV